MEKDNKNHVITGIIAVIVGLILMVVGISRTFAAPYSYFLDYSDFYSKSFDTVSPFTVTTLSDRWMMASEEKAGYLYGAGADVNTKLRIFNLTTNTATDISSAIGGQNMATNDQGIGFMDSKVFFANGGSTITNLYYVNDTTTASQTPNLAFTCPISGEEIYKVFSYNSKIEVLCLGKTTRESRLYGIDSSLSYTLQGSYGTGFILGEDLGNAWDSQHARGIFVDGDYLRYVKRYTGESTYINLISFSNSVFSGPTQSTTCNQPIYKKYNGIYYLSCGSSGIYSSSSFTGTFTNINSNSLNAYSFTVTYENNGPSATCSDGIQNQDETGIDCGGVCGPCANCSDGILNQDEIDIDYGGVCGFTGYQQISVDGKVCKIVTYPEYTSSGLTITGTLTDNSSAILSGTVSPDLYKFTFTNGLDTSVFKLYDPANSTGAIGIIIDTDTFTNGLNADVNTTIHSDIDYIDAGNPTAMSFVMTRGGKTSPINYVAIKTDNTGFNSLSDPYQNIVANVKFYGLDGGNYTYPMVYTGGYAIALSRYNAWAAEIYFVTGDVTMKGFETGLSNSGTITKTSCSGPDFDCQFHQQSPGVFTCDSSLNPSGTAQGSCTISSGICQPVPDTVPFYDGTIVPGGAVEKAINASGSTVGLTYKEEDIFSCSYSGLGTLLCPFEVLRKVWSKFTEVLKKLANFIYGVSSIASPKGTGQIISFFFPVAYADDLGKSIPTAGFNSTANGHISTSYSGTDYANMNKTMFRAGDNVFNLQSGGIKGLFSWSQWVLIILGLIFVIAIFLLAFL